MDGTDSIIRVRCDRKYLFFSIRASRSERWSPRTPGCLERREKRGCECVLKRKKASVHTPFVGFDAGRAGEFATLLLLTRGETGMPRKGQIRGRNAGK